MDPFEIERTYTILKTADLHSVAIIEFPKWQTLFQLQKFKYI